MRFATIILLCSFFCLSASAQMPSPFKHLPNFSHQNLKPSLSSVTDSVYGAIRFLTNIATYAEPGNQLQAGVGIGYQKIDYNYSTQLSKCEWSVTAMMWAGGSTAPSSPDGAIAFGIMAGFFNNLILIGPGYNPVGKTFQINVGIGVNLN